jgi:hypothetical protein
VAVVAVTGQEQCVWMVDLRGRIVHVEQADGRTIVVRDLTSGERFEVNVGTAWARRARSARRWTHPRPAG